MAIRFGTDGWRAIIAEDYTFDNVRLCAQAVADYLNDKGAARNGLVVGYDTRFSSEHFAAAVAEVAAANGVPSFLCDRAAPTPVISYAVLDKKAAGAVIITASHNPGEYNGLKYKPEYAGSASPEVVAELEKRIDRIASPTNVKRQPLAAGLDSGLIKRFDPAPPYLAQIARLVDLPTLRDAGLKVMADVMYGAGEGYIAGLLAGGKTVVRQLHPERNPAFPGLRPEPIPPNIDALGKEVVAWGADIGLATDGDADRIGVVDEEGQYVNQLQMFGLLILYLLEVKGWRGPIVKALTTTSMADRLGEMYNLPVHETGVGFKYVGPKMMETDAIIGGEESGGFGFRGHIPERDGILAGLFLTDMCVRLQRRPSELVQYLFSKVGPHYYDRLDLHFPAEQRATIMSRLQKAAPKEIDGTPVTNIGTADGFKFYLADGTWVLVRFSGTEPLLRVYTETNAPDRVARMLAAGRELAGL
ncbi:MAG: phosphoglucomutase/phosphomannomutase family protein [Chloroflexi bacterium]|nr:phosphoglucomutase/phosphomannomutase family protein [Chloroflexota bacterium]